METEHIINRDEIRLKVIHHVAERTRTTCISLAAAFIISVGCFFHEIYSSFRIFFEIYTILFFSSLLFRDWYARQLIKNKFNADEVEWKLLVSVWATSILLGLGITSILIHFEESTISLVFLMVAAGLSSSALVTLSANKFAMRGYFTFMLLPIVITGIILGTNFSKSSAIIAFVYYLYLFSISKIVQKQSINQFINEIILTKQAQELLESKNLAIENLSSKTDFIARVSHEVRTPLNGIIGTIELLQDQKLDEESTENVKLLSVSATNLLDIVNELLDVSKINAGKFELRFSPFEISNAVEDVFSMYRTIASHQKLNYELEIDPELMNTNILADLLKLKQVLSNLISNSIKYTKTGTIKVVLKKLNDVNGKLTIRFMVEDTGVGLNQAEMEQLFKPYEQIERVSKAIKGTGLGLFISNEICKKMGGEKKIESIPNQKTVFSFDLTFQRSNLNLQISEKEIENNNYNFSVLVTDDNEINLNLMQKYFTKLNCKTELASNGELAIEKFKNLNFDLILMDINMPNKDGIQTLNEMKGLNKKMPVVVAFTANVSKEDIDMYKKSGFNHFLGKPASIKDLRVILNSVKK